MKSIAVFISGSGTNLQALIDASNAGALNAKIGLVVSNKQSAFGLKRAESNNIPTYVQSLKAYKDNGKTRIDFDKDLAQKVLQAFNGQPPSLIVLAGFMHILSAEFLQMFPDNTVINLHPALPGCFDGAKAIERAYEAYKEGKITHTGVMVHWCIPEVDRGKVIIQQECPIYDKDQIGDLETRIHEIEHQLIVKGANLALE